MSIANRITATQNQITEHRRNNPVVLSPVQQQLADALSKKEELLFLLANKPSEEESLAQLERVEEQLKAVRHDKAVLEERIRLRAAAKAENATTATAQRTAKSAYTVPSHLTGVERAIFIKYMESQG